MYAGLRAATEHTDYQMLSDARCPLRVPRRDPLDRPDGFDGDRRGGAADAAVDRLRTSPARPKDADHRRCTSHRSARASDVPYQRGRPDRVPLRTASPMARSAPHARRPIPAVDIDGLRRRTRALAGRCQGFYCSAEVCRLAHKRRPPDRRMARPGVNSVDVLVVGGGPAGLSPSLTALATSGATVTIAEREHHVGRHTSPHRAPRLRHARLAPVTDGPRVRAPICVDSASVAGACELAPDQCCALDGGRADLRHTVRHDARSMPGAVVLRDRRPRATARRRAWCPATGRPACSRPARCSSSTAIASGGRPAGGDRRRRARQLLGDPHPAARRLRRRRRW